MFVCNFKFNKKLFMRIFKIVIAALALILLVASILAIFKSSNIHEPSMEKTNHIELDSNNYTNFLKSSHENITTYLGANVTVTGYVYRLPDFSDNQFVLARTMLINSNSQAVVVGILCECSNAKDFSDYSWVKINGTVEKGNYHGDIPILRVHEIKNTKTPVDEFVAEPYD